MTGAVLITVMVATLIIQALIPARKMMVILSGATVAVTLAATLGNQRIGDIYSGVPWDVLVILLGLGIFSSLFARSRLFSALAVWCSRASRGKYLLILIMFSSIMFILSCTLNNLTALLLEDTKENIAIISAKTIPNSTSRTSGRETSAPGSANVAAGLFQSNIAKAAQAPRTAPANCAAI